MDKDNTSTGSDTSLAAIEADLSTSSISITVTSASPELDISTSTNDPDQFKDLVYFDPIPGPSTDPPIVLVNNEALERLQHQNLGENYSDPATVVSMIKDAWITTNRFTVLPVRCGNVSAELHKYLLGSGNRGSCIKMGSEWLTPNEFEQRCGYGNRRDWKRSITFGGQKLLSLIEDGLLFTHSMSCICFACTSDVNSTSPVHLNVPIKRKKRQGSTMKEARSKHKQEENSEDSDSNANSSSKKQWSSVSEILEELEKSFLNSSSEVSFVGQVPGNPSLIQKVDKLMEQFMGFSASFSERLFEIRDHLARQSKETRNVEVQTSTISTTEL